MCGIVGIASATVEQKLNEKDLFQELLYVDSLRGAHGTGCFGIPTTLTNMAPAVIKMGVSADVFLQTKTFTDFIGKGFSMKFMVGHNRHATRGVKNTAFAHPFQHKHIIMVHNGTLRTMDYLPAAAEQGSDSNRIAAGLAEWGAKRTLERLHGAFALVWYDLHRNKLCMARNDERPLWFCLNESRKHMLFGSEPEMLQFVGFRNGMKILDDDCYRLEPGWLCEWDHDCTDFKHYTTERFHFYDPPVVRRPTKPAYDPTAYGRKQHQLPPPRKSTSTTGGTGTTTYEIALEANKERMNTLLEPFGIEVGDELEFLPSQYAAHYKGKVEQDEGTLFGIAEAGDNESLDVEVYFFPKAMHNKEHQCYSGKISTAYVTDDSRVIVGMLYESVHVSVYEHNPDTLESWVEAEKLPFNYKRRSSSSEGWEAEATIPGPDGTLVTPAEFHGMTANGCVFCSAAVPAEDASKICWTHDDRPYCKECARKAKSGEIVMV